MTKYLDVNSSSILTYDVEELNYSGFYRVANSNSYSSNFINKDYSLIKLVSKSRELFYLDIVYNSEAADTSLDLYQTDDFFLLVKKKCFFQMGLFIMAHQ